MVRVKICGLKRVEEMLWAVAAGASAVGLVFAPSVRRVTPEEARLICRRVPPFVTRVGVFVNEDPARVRWLARECGLDAVQLHGDEDPAAYRFPGGPRVIKTVRVHQQTPEEILAAISGWEVDALLLDTLVPGTYGGSGSSFNWLTAAAVRERWPGPLILAGGLRPDNVRQAITTVRPFAVDVSSGVERDGQKDRALIWEFISQVQKAQAEEE
ncbi:MAG: phosphoribosylanthranilate isomerase [Moorellales bacterium]